MPQPRAKYPLDLVEEVLAGIGVYLYNQFEDGQTLWGTEEARDPSTGSFALADNWQGGFDVPTIISILNRTDRYGHHEQIIERLDQRMTQTNGEAEVEPTHDEAR